MNTTTSAMWCSAVYLPEPRDYTAEERRDGRGRKRAVPAELIRQACELERTGKARNEVARILKISRTALWRYLGPLGKKARGDK
jgi:hypothetical protein